MSGCGAVPGRWAALIAVWIAVVVGPLAEGADAPAPVARSTVERHGASDAFAAPGIALAWAVLRGRDEATTEVVVRVEAEAGSFGSLGVVGVDPFTRASAPLRVPAPIGRVTEVRIPRARFAELPRTEWRLYRSSAPAAHEAPALLVYYQGVPDTTPEFDDAAKLSADLAARIERARREAEGKRP